MNSTLKIKEALAEQGIDAVEVETVKNGVTCTGFQILTGSNIAPVVYYAPEETVEAFVERVVRLKNQPLPGIDPAELVSRERLLNCSFLCIQRKSGEDIVKRDYLNLELYLRLAVELPENDTKGTVKITPQILNLSGVTEAELFEAARANSLRKTEVCSMAEALGLPEEFEVPTYFYVASYDDKCHGAGVLALPEVIHEYCEKHGFNGAYIIPSSTEEILLISREDADPADLAAMVDEINSSVVDPVLWLDPVIYEYDDVTREVSIASSYREGA